MKDKLGMLHIYCGDGKGKTTACMGQAVRAAGRGLKVYILQFLKGRETGEVAPLQNVPNISFIRGNITPKFSFNMTDEEKAETTAIHNDMLLKAIGVCRDGKCEMLILDELLDAWNTNLIDRDVVLAFLKDRRGVEVIISGRNPAPELCDLADYLTEVKKIKHPFDKGIPAREGVEK